MKSKLIYLLGLLSITIPTKGQATHKDSNGNPFEPKNIMQPMGLKTAYPIGLTSWSVINDAEIEQWKRKFKVGKKYSRFEVSPKSDKIINRKPLILSEALRG